MVTKFRKTGNVADAYKGHSCRHRSTIIPENTQNLRERLEESPRKPPRRPSQETGILRTSVLRYFHNDLKLFAYKIQILQRQTGYNKAERETFCEDISHDTEIDHGLLHLIFFSGEAHLHLSGCINKQNMQFWAQVQSHEHTHRPFSQEKVTSWCVIGRTIIIGPFFFEDDNENQVTLDTDRYIALMWTTFIPALRSKRGVDMDHSYLPTKWSTTPQFRQIFEIPWQVFSW